FQHQFSTNQTITNYLPPINPKAPLLIQLSTQLPPITSNPSSDLIPKLKVIPHYIGITFQIIHHLLHFTASQNKLPNPLPTHLINPHITLPLLLQIPKNNTFKHKISQLNPH
ncbi:polyprenyl synthetase family protein, partial [Staphylococcus epidermidis]|uniref:polyprenyl synthetase family protein n=1 Tax=Staphylococcus epidermidis TaxID=1282 RepID=UPI001642711D